MERKIAKTLSAQLVPSINSSLTRHWVSGSGFTVRGFPTPFSAVLTLESWACMRPNFAKPPIFCEVHFFLCESYGGLCVPALCAPAGPVAQGQGPGAHRDLQSTWLQAALAPLPGHISISATDFKQLFEVGN